MTTGMGCNLMQPALLLITLLHLLLLASPATCAFVAPTIRAATIITWPSASPLAALQHRQFSYLRYDGRRNFSSVLDSAALDFDTSLDASSLLGLYADTESSSFGSIATGVVAAALVLAVAAFTYANVVYTPEIIENAASLRREKRDVEIGKVLLLVNQHREEGLDMEELRRPLEEALGMTIDKYMSRVEEEESVLTVLTDADRELAGLLRASLQIR